MLRIVEVVPELVRALVPVVRTIGGHDPALAKQLRDALNSVGMNLAEGSDQRGARKTNHYAIALGSAREALMGLRLAEAWGIAPALDARTSEMFRQILGTLTKLVARR